MRIITLRSERLSLQDTRGRAKPECYVLGGIGPWYRDRNKEAKGQLWVPKISSLSPDGAISRPGMVVTVQSLLPWAQALLALLCPRPVLPPQVWRDSICALAKVRGWVEMGGIRSLGFVCSISSLHNLDFNRLKFKAYLCLVVSLCLLWQVQH